MKARYVLGLTATPVRKDGHHPIFRMQCGPIRYHLDARAQAARRPFQHLVIPRPTHFRLPESQELSIQQIFAKLAADPSRNDQIFDDLVAALDEEPWKSTPISTSGAAGFSSMDPAWISLIRSMIGSTRRAEKCERAERFR
ncbi:MAG: hypothetical protein ACRD1R_12630 [Acidobacteriota bacterium]